MTYDPSDWKQREIINRVTGEKFVANVPKTMVDMVREWSIAYKRPVSDKLIPLPKLPAQLWSAELNKIYELRGRLHHEEFTELEFAMAAANEKDIIDGICDLIWVLIGTALELGLPIENGFREVFRSNMSKLGPDGKPILREDGKILKGPNFTPPDWDKVFKEWERK